MDNLLPENETVEVEGLRYLNPNLVIDETNTFIDKLRGTQGMNTQEIATQTEMLGTDIPSSQGGLIGANSYFTSRYQTPQTNSAVANLRRVAQESALNQALANEQAIWKKRYQQAYRNYQSRQNARINNPTSVYTTTTQGEVEYENTDPASEEVYSVEPSYSPAGSGTFEYDTNKIKPNGNSIFKTDDRFNQSTSIFGGDVEIQRDKFGNITSLTHGGKTFTGEAAQKKYKALQAAGTIGGRK